MIMMNMNAILKMNNYPATQTVSQPPSHHNPGDKISICTKKLLSGLFLLFTGDGQLMASHEQGLSNSC